MARTKVTVAALALTAGGLAAPASAKSPPPQLPLVVIDTAQRIVDDPKVDATMRILSGRSTTRFWATRFSGRVGIEIRGNSSMAYPKKQYAIEVRDRQGKGRDARLLGMPRDDTGCCRAPTATRR
jgi:hypothetical protein